MLAVASEAPESRGRLERRGGYHAAVGVPPRRYNPVRPLRAAPQRGNPSFSRHLDRSPRAGQPADRSGPCRPGNQPHHRTSAGPPRRADRTPGIRLRDDRPRRHPLADPVRGLRGGRDRGIRVRSSGPRVPRRGGAGRRRWRRRRRDRGGTARSPVGEHPGRRRTRRARAAGSRGHRRGHPGGRHQRAFRTGPGSARGADPRRLGSPDLRGSRPQ